LVWLIAISRLISSYSAPDEEFIIAALQAEFDMDVPISCLPVTFDKFRSFAEKVVLLQRVKKFIKSSWPDLRLLCQHADSSQLEGFYRRRDSLTIEQGCFLVRERVIISTTLWTKVLRFLHQGHPGIQRMKSLARKYAYWPGMDHDIEEMVRLCGPCAAAAAKQPLKATLHSWPPATKPRERIHIDFAGPHLERHFLIVVDTYSKYPDVISVCSMTSRKTVAILHKLCAQHGVPETIASDNRMQFTSHEFGELCKANTISHILSPPYHPQSKGWAERFVDTFKRGLLKQR
jgi:transposase InsO family protein